MSLLAGPYLVAIVLLGAGGALTVVRPATTARAVREIGLPVSSTVVRAGALVELTIAAGALVGGGRPLATLVAASYCGFAIFVLAALRRDVPLSTCGCFGAADTPPTALHLGFNVAAAAVAGAVALTGSAAGGLTEVATSEGSLLPLVGFLASTAASVWLAYVAFAVPRVAGTRKIDR